VWRGDRRILLISRRMMGQHEYGSSPLAVIDAAVPDIRGGLPTARP
jgi:hypothetical protein